MKKRKGNEGYDVAADEYTDLVKAGIVDPTKVARTAYPEPGADPPEDWTNWQPEHDARRGHPQSLALPVEP